jgi:hypothetical protein
MSQSSNQQPTLPPLDEQINFIKGGIKVLENVKDAQIVIDKNNMAMLKAIDESLGEIKLHE